MIRDLRTAIRSLRRRPWLTLAAVVSLALGIGVNSAIFSVFDRLMLRKLPVRAPNQIVVLRSRGRKPGSTSRAIPAAARRCSVIRCSATSNG